LGAEYCRNAFKRLRHFLAPVVRSGQPERHCAAIIVRWRVVKHWARVKDQLCRDVWAPGVANFFESDDL
jgi:hypothetical protein